MDASESSLLRGGEGKGAVSAAAGHDLPWPLTLFVGVLIGRPKARLSRRAPVHGNNRHSQPALDASS
jgi:hypothetical protein